MSGRIHAHRRRNLRSQVGAPTRAVATVKGVGKRDRLYVRAAPEDLERWKRAARAAGARSLSAFVRELLDAQPVPPSAVVNAPAPPPPREEPEPDWKAVIDGIAQGRLVNG
jgi:hypothetical protein